MRKNAKAAVETIAQNVEAKTTTKKENTMEKTAKKAVKAAVKAEAKKELVFVGYVSTRGEIRTVGTVEWDAKVTVQAVTVTCKNEGITRVRKIATESLCKLTKEQYKEIVENRKDTFVMKDGKINKRRRVEALGKGKQRLKGTLTLANGTVAYIRFVPRIQMQA